MVNLKLVFTHQAKKDAKKLSKNNLKSKASEILGSIEKSPLSQPYEKLAGDYKGAYSKRISIQHRIVYQIYKQEKIVKVLRMWTHYE